MCEGIRLSVVYVSRFQDLAKDLSMNEYMNSCLFGGCSIISLCIDAGADYNPVVTEDVRYTIASSECSYIKRSNSHS